ncbi:MAG: metallophosphoesterase [Cyclobacteriaceae bacterium]
MRNTFVIGDIHGSYRAMLQCFAKSGFNYQEDTLICLGDVADGWPETNQAIEELLKIKNLIYILGNHDFWNLDWMETGYANEVWLNQGGQATVNSYTETAPESHSSLLRTARPYYLHENSFFVHAGINPNKPLNSQGIQTFLWDRNFANKARALHKEDVKNRLTTYDAVYIGHTPIQEPHPKQYCEVWMMDTGAGWSGRLSMMNIESKEFFVSDPVPELYPGIEGRKKF